MNSLKGNTFLIKEEFFSRGAMAQLLREKTYNHKVVGSNPSDGYQMKCQQSLKKLKKINKVSQKGDTKKILRKERVVEIGMSLIISRLVRRNLQSSLIFICYDFRFNLVPGCLAIPDLPLLTNLRTVCLSSCVRLRGT